MVVGEQKASLLSVAVMLFQGMRAAAGLESSGADLFLA